MKERYLKFLKSKFKHSALVFVLSEALILGLPMTLWAQAKPLGVLSIFQDSAHNTRTVKVNGVNVIGEQTITSPSVIETSGDAAEISVGLGGAGRINLAADTKMNLIFDEHSVSGILQRGKITIFTCSGTKLNIRTKDGIVKAADATQQNFGTIDFTDSKTRVKPISGAFIFNQTLIQPKQSYTAGDFEVKHIDAGKNPSFFNFLIVSVEIVILSVLGETASSQSSIETGDVNVGPMR